MKTRLILFYLVVFFVNIVILPQNTIGFDIDVAKFNYDNESVYLEIYYSFAQNTLETELKDSDSFISSDLQVNLTNSKGESIINENYTLNSAVDTSSKEYKNEDLIGLLGFKVPTGIYDLKVSVKDNFGSGKIKSFEDKINLKSLSDADVTISDIELCSKIIQEGADPNSIYYKNSLEVIPNPKNVFGLNLPTLFYYSEFYNNTTSDLSNLKFKRVVTQNEGMYDLFEEKISLTKGAIVKAGMINLSDFISGRYTLEMTIMDSSNNVISNESKNFFVYNPQNSKNRNFSDPQQSYVRSEFGILAEEECDYIFDVSKFIAAQSEKTLYYSIKDLDSKRKFLYEFWKKRDLEPETPRNEFHQQYMARVDYVNDNYGHRHKKGYKTDRGRVALIYGLPDQVDTQTNDAELKPYEVWTYNSIEGGVMFVFGDTMGISELELLHSTKRGELADYNWQTRLTIKGGF